MLAKILQSGISDGAKLTQVFALHYKTKDPQKLAELRKLPRQIIDMHMRESARARIEQIQVSQAPTFAEEQQKPSLTQHYMRLAKSLGITLPKLPVSRYHCVFRVLLKKYNDDEIQRMMEAYLNSPRGKNDPSITGFFAEKERLYAKIAK